jgi:hypothetical protein
VHLTVLYIESILTRLLKNLNNMKSRTLLDTPILNHDYEIDSIYFILNGDDSCPLFLRLTFLPSMFDPLTQT